MGFSIRAAVVPAAAAVLLARSGSAAVLEFPVTLRNTYACIDISVGTPPQNHVLVFDTGSATSWIANENCVDGGCDNVSGYPWKAYDSDSSVTSKDLGIYDSISYLGGGTGGEVYSDRFSHDGLTWTQTFISANQTSMGFIAGEGFFGLAFSSIAEQDTKTVMETLMQDRQVDFPRFGLYYGTEFNDTHGHPGKGVLTLGDSHERKYVDGDVAWVPGKKDSGVYELWRSNLKTFYGERKDNNGNIQNNGSLQYDLGAANGVFDTGAGLIYVPDATIDAVYDSIGWNYTALLHGDYLPSCTDMNSTWSVTFTFESDEGSDFTNITLTGDQLKIPGFAYQTDKCNPPFSTSGSPHLFLLGQLYLRNFYSIFDFGGLKVEDYNVRIGFGNLKKEWRGI
ncbi:hypothetical protein TGAMA5MH_04441 [Trichoderma gamsii]|uniref:Peptidase A1 domain-containing protein n=1 Tax=Trichoderma gamsii TaxID=398673 RepID=A0A2K0TF54_9HYPO|nr:hypothetical protein TGAMA5MH_04441 [Trichoderma gamsii]